MFSITTEEDRQKEESKKAKVKREGKPQNDAQKLASKENYALFQLRAMRTNTHWLVGLVPTNMQSAICEDIDEAVVFIKAKQFNRQQKRKEAKK